MTAPESNTFLKRVRAIRDFVARHIDSGVARESKKASCAALRSNASKNASKNVSKSSFVKSSKNSSRKACGSCTSRALLSLFVASATLLATFVIAPTSALSAGENAGVSTGANTVSTKKVEGAKSDSAKTDGEKKQPEQSEPNNTTEPNKKNTDTSSTLNKDNKESKPVEKQNPDSNKVDDKAKSTEAAVNKNAKDAKNKAADSAKASSKMDRSARKLKECSTLSACYNISYDFGNATTVDNGKTILINRGDARPITPKFDLKPKKKPATNNLLDGLWFKLEKDGEDSVPSWANFEKDNGATKVKDTSKDKAGFNGSVTLRPGKWDNRGSHKFKIVIYRTDKDKKIVNISVKVDESDISKNDLSLSLYDFGKADDKVSVSNDKITIKPKSKGSAPSGGTDGSDTDGTGKKDTYDPINKLFIESQSKDKPGLIHHHMICKTGSGDDASYTVDSVNGLSLSAKDSGTGTQTQFKHVENNKPSIGAEDSSVYLDDKYTERSQSWISGTPTKAGTFECRVFAIKDTKLVSSGGGKHFESSTVSDEFNKKVKDNDGKESLFNGNLVEDKWTNKASIKQGVDWDYKSVTIEVKSSKPPKPTIGDNDLTLKVYPFKDSPTALSDKNPGKNNKISAILGMSLKPFVDATSAADSTKKITLRVLCSKDEKKAAAGGGGASTGGAGSTTGSGSDGSGSSGATSGTGSSGVNTSAGSHSSAQSGSQPSQTVGSLQSAEDLEYKTWSSNPAGLGLSVPTDTEQNTCHSNKEGETTCASADPSKKVAARTDKEVSIKPTKVGNYQCVVFALKPKALAKFDGLTGTLTPDSIKSELTKASPTAFKEHKDFAAFTLNIHLSSNFTLPHTGGQSWNLQLGILAALLVNLLAAGFVVSQSERGRKLILGRWRGLCNHV